jgi:hypothetical protein
MAGAWTPQPGPQVGGVRSQKPDTRPSARLPVLLGPCSRKVPCLSAAEEGH